MSESIETKDCPFCAETILTKAIKCKHCGADLNAPQKPAYSPPAPIPEVAKTKSCGFCGESVMLEAKKCKHCGSDLTSSDAPPSLARQPSAQTTELASIPNCANLVKTKTRQYILMCIVVSILYIIFNAMDGAFSALLMGILVIVALTLFVKSYRCPNCKKYINLLMPPPICKQCGAILKG